MGCRLPCLACAVSAESEGIGLLWSTQGCPVNEHLCTGSATCAQWERRYWLERQSSLDCNPECKGRALPLMPWASGRQTSTPNSLLRHFLIWSGSGDAWIHTRVLSARVHKVQGRYQSLNRAGTVFQSRVNWSLCNTDREELSTLWQSRTKEMVLSVSTRSLNIPNLLSELKFFIYLSQCGGLTPPPGVCGTNTTTESQPQLSSLVQPSQAWALGPCLCSRVLGPQVCATMLPCF